MKPRKTRRESMQIGIHCFEIRFVETIVFTDLVQLVKPYKTSNNSAPGLMFDVPLQVMTCSVNRLVINDANRLCPCFYGFPRLCS